MGFPLQDSPRQCGWHYAARVRNHWWAWLQVLGVPDTGLPEPSRRRPRPLLPLLGPSTTWNPLCRQLHRNRALHISLSLASSLSLSPESVYLTDSHSFICHQYFVMHFIHLYLIIIRQILQLKNHIFNSKISLNYIKQF